MFDKLSEEYQDHSMTLPDERYRAVRLAEQFLSRLAAGDIPHVPQVVRDEARSILRHYPGSWDLHRAAELAPGVFQERMEDLHRFIQKGVAQRGHSDDGSELEQGYRE